MGCALKGQGEVHGELLPDTIFHGIDTGGFHVHGLRDFFCGFPFDEKAQVSALHRGKGLQCRDEQSFMAPRTAFILLRRRLSRAPPLLEVQGYHEQDENSHREAERQKQYDYTFHFAKIGKAQGGSNRQI